MENFILYAILHIFMYTRMNVASKTKEILDRSFDEPITVEDGNYLMNLKGSDIYALLTTADAVRREIVGDNVTFINNCNINFTNVCTVRCGFCGFGKDIDDPEAYILNDEQILAKAQGAVDTGAREFCVMGGVLKDADIEYYEHLLKLLKSNFPQVDIHGFSPTMIADAAKVSEIPTAEAFKILKKAGLGTIPGTAAEILNDRTREIVCPNKVSTEEWIRIIKEAHNGWFCNHDVRPCGDNRGACGAY